MLVSTQVYIPQEGVCMPRREAIDPARVHPGRVDLLGAQKMSVITMPAMNARPKISPHSAKNFSSLMSPPI
jgi:hypothetical protein